MDPTELTNISIFSKRENGGHVTIPVELVRSEAVCESAGRPVDLVCGQLMERYSDNDSGNAPILIQQGTDSPTCGAPTWVAIYRPTSTVYYLDMQTAYFCVIHYEDTNGAAELRLEKYLNAEANTSAES
ncbi:MAG: hypothetical protein NC114_06530 [Ruminococcus flavefaciens]|nr:hypothetical protein [Ruminococcus flavefaciens]